MEVKPAETDTTGMDWRNGLERLRADPWDETIWPLFIKEAHATVLARVKYFRWKGKDLLPQGWHEDVTDDVMGKIIQGRLSEFSWEKSRHNPGEDKQALMAYIRKMAWNQAYDKVKKTKKETAILDFYPDAPDATADAEKQEHLEMQRLINDAVEKLPEEEKFLVRAILIPEDLRSADQRELFARMNPKAGAGSPDRDNQKNRLTAVALYLNKELKGPALETETQRLKDQLRAILKKLRSRLHKHYGFEGGNLVYKNDKESEDDDLDAPIRGALLAWARENYPTPARFRAMLASLSTPAR